MQFERFLIEHAVRIKIATWNLNTWINRRDKGITNTELWKWADDHLGADVVVFTEAQTPPPRAVIDGQWSTAHRPEGFPGVSKWGTVIAARTSSKVRVERITSVGADKSYEVDSNFPGTFTAADLFFDDRCIATIIGLHLRYRKDKNGKFIGHPEDDLDALKQDFEAVFKDRKKPLIVAGDFNYEMEEMPTVLKRLGKQDFALIDAFKDQTQATFEQDWGDRHWFCLDYMFLSNRLYAKIDDRHGGLNEFPTALAVSDHAPLVVGLNIADLLKQK
jgi:endonuclease/exonuclease/phosphatase family metal-dependent hydrolase